MLKWAISSNYKEHYRFVLYTNCEDIAKKMFPKDVTIISSYWGLFHQLTSKYVFVEQNGHKWLCKPTRKQKIVQLWHGTPIKKVGSLNNQQQWFKYNEVYTHVLAPSDYSWTIMKKCYGYDDNKRIICPYTKRRQFDPAVHRRKLSVDGCLRSSFCRLWVRRSNPPCSQW